MTVQSVPGSVPEKLDRLEGRNAARHPGPLPVHDGVLEAIGSTPLVRLRRLPGARPVEVYAKVEAFNPGGSIKDRPALAIIEQALRNGTIGPDTIVIESSSGNMGIGLAQACRYHGLRFLCVVDYKTTLLNLRVLRAYGAEIEIVREPDPETGELLQARLQRVRDLMARHENAFWPNQYGNPENSGSHYRTTMHEIVSALDGRVDYLFAATSTCGTIRGCGDYVQDHGLDTRIIAVDALGSLIFGSQPGPRRIPGLGAGLRPSLCKPELIERCVHVTDLDCVLGCRRLMRSEALLAGGSAGGVVAAFQRIAPELAPDSCCVLLLCDRGERYLDSVYDDEWVREHVGIDPQELASLLEESSAGRP